MSVNVYDTLFGTYSEENKHSCCLSLSCQTTPHAQTLVTSPATTPKPLSHPPPPHPRQPLCCDIPSNPRLFTSGGGSGRREGDRRRGSAPGRSDGRQAEATPSDGDGRRRRKRRKRRTGTKQLVKKKRGQGSTCVFCCAMDYLLRCAISQCLKLPSGCWHETLKYTRIASSSQRIFLL